MSNDLSRMPKAGLYDARGRMTRAGHAFLAGLDKIANLGKSVADVMGGGQKTIQSEGLWATMNGVVSSGDGLYRPDLIEGLDFVRFLTGATEMGLPQSVPGLSLPFFSVLFIQDETGGRPLTFTDDYVGEAPVILDGANDQTLVGFKVLRRAPDVFTGWAIKGIVAT